MTPVVSRHRLPPPYRVGLTLLWIVPLLLFIAVIVFKTGINPALLDPRFVAPALLMIAPALYFWQEGIDVRQDGITRRMHVPRFYRFAELRRWEYDARADRHVLTVWTGDNAKALECRAGHLTDFPTLLAALEDGVSARDCAGARSTAE